MASGSVRVKNQGNETNIIMNFLDTKTQVNKAAAVIAQSPTSLKDLHKQIVYEYSSDTIKLHQ